MNFDMTPDIAAALRRIEAKLDVIKARLSAQPVEDKEPLLTVSEAANHYRISESALYKLKAVQVKVGRRVRVSRAAMDQYCQRG